MGRTLSASLVRPNELQFAFDQSGDRKVTMDEMPRSTPHWEVSRALGSGVLGYLLTTNRYLRVVEFFRSRSSIPSEQSGLTFWM